MILIRCKIYFRWKARRALNRDLKKASRAFADEVMHFTTVGPEELEKYRSIPWGETTGWRERTTTGPFLPTHDENGKPIEWSGAGSYPHPSSGPENPPEPRNLTRWMKNG